MELYLDTANLTAIERLSRQFPLQGVTTNPSIVAAAGIALAELLPAIRALVGPQARLFAQVLSEQADAMVIEAQALRRLDPDLVIKVPVCGEGLVAIKRLTLLGIPTLGTAVYSPMQGLLAALAGAVYVAPYVNRIDAQGGNGIASVRELQQLLSLHAPHCQLLAASFKTPRQALDCLLSGASAITLPVEVAEQMIHSPAVDAALVKFRDDWQQAFGTE